MKIVEVAAGLVFRDSHLLLSQRYENAHQGSLWEFPGGKRESHETYEECLQRELREELGITVRPESLVDSITHAYPDKTVHLQFFKCRLLQGEPRPIECQALVWVTLEQLDQYAFPAADARLLAKLRTQRELWT